MRAALPATKVVRLAWTPTSHGLTSVSLWLTLTASRGTPSVSATIMARAVSDPCPSSEDPEMRATRPESSILIMAPQPSDP